MITSNTILSPEEIKTFYFASLDYSGFISIDGYIKKAWEQLVLSNGNNPIPPGFLAKLIMSLDHKEAGKLKETENRREDDLIEIIKKSPSFAQLEGEFIARGKLILFKEIYRTFEIFLEKLNFFYHNKYKLYQKHIDSSLKKETNFSEDFPAINLLEEIYESAIDYIISNNTSLESTDLFEIHHYKLFEGESMVRLRFIYKNMINFNKLIKKRLLSQITLRTETDNVIRSFGEPQVLMLGGYDSLTNKGDISSIVPSELAYIDETEVFDYFDYKYIQKELLYFQREEGSVFRIRRNIHLEIILSSEMELDENISLLFAFCLSISEKLISVFQKDILFINIYLQGFMPTSIEKAINFFEHFIHESSLQNNILLTPYSSLESIIKKKRGLQHIIIGKTENKKCKTINFEFPYNEDFYQMNFERKGILLSLLINNLIEEIVNIAYR